MPANTNVDFSDRNGFYVQPKGGFATAAHVALEAQRLLAIAKDSFGIAHTLEDGRSFFLPVWKFFVHKTADVAFGIPRYEFVNDTTGTAYRTKVLSLAPHAPNVGAAISTWAYPLHRVSDEGASGQVLQLQPDFYDGILEELYEDRGPSVKLKPPYYRTSINLHGGASGGPVFNADGNVFGVASCSYDGATEGMSRSLLKFGERTLRGGEATLLDAGAQERGGEVG